MSPRRTSLAVAAPLVASFVVLAIAEAGPTLWLQQACAVGLAGLAAAGGCLLAGRVRVPAVLVLALALAGVAAPLLIDTPPPRRWIPIGPIRLYMAPVLLPLVLLTRHVMACSGSHGRTLGDAAIVLAGAALALQPDASQALALLVAVTVSAWRGSPDLRIHPLAWAVAALTCGWAFSRPDPLQPLPYVEGVVSLAFAHSTAAGVLVVSAEIAFLVALWRAGGALAMAMPGVTAYYGVLFLCAHAGLTPAPLIGYGAGPWLGYGLLAAYLCSAARSARACSADR